ncbi:acyl-CoA thioesterase/BAAT N-terminal domain-containing protein [Bacillus sp. JCM 19041]|uniref:acyl-CoA thioesterase/BAAT N-terminal domain-containing protein n=1 Tax=Bacillus sp. JCM 19041 TaxID=1460637 RepID=UPI0006D1F3B6
MVKPNILVTPLQSNFDEEIDIVVSGCDPGDEVTLKASLYDDRNELYMSEATFKVNQNGEVDLAKESPIAGTYAGVDRNGIFWSAIHKKKKYDDYFLKSNTNELKVLLQLYIQNEFVDEFKSFVSFIKNR